MMSIPMIAEYIPGLVAPAPFMAKPRVIAIAITQ